MSNISSYRFGQIVIDGKKYTGDVVIFPDHVEANWFRKAGHQLGLEDISSGMEKNPNAIVIGTGAFGMVKVNAEVITEAERRGIKLIIEPTEDACQTYNQLSQTEEVIAALHLTC